MDRNAKEQDGRAVQVEQTNIEHIRDRIGAESFDKAVDAAIDARYPRVEKDGTKVLEYYWDYKDREALGRQLADLVNEGEIWYDRERFRYMDAPPSWEERRADPERFESAPLPDSSADELHAAIESYLYETGMRNWGEEYEFQEISAIASDIKEALSEAAEAAGVDLAGVEYWEWSEYLMDEKQVHVDLGYDSELESVELRLELGFNTGEEWNSDFTYMTTAFEDVIGAALEDDGPCHADDLDIEALENNSLTWIAATQGLDLASYVEQMGEKGNPFTESLDEELLNRSNNMNILTLCARVPYRDYLELAAGEASFTVEPTCRGFMMGMYNPWAGGGSLMGLQPMDSFVIDRSNIQRIDAEGGTNRPYSYTVAQVYGFAGDEECWSRCLTRNEPDKNGEYPRPVKPKVNVRELAAAINAKKGIHTSDNPTAADRSRARRMSMTQNGSSSSSKKTER